MKTFREKVEEAIEKHTFSYIKTDGTHCVSGITDAVISILQAAMETLVPEERGYPTHAYPDSSVDSLKADGWNACREEIEERIGK